MPITPESLNELTGLHLSSQTPIRTVRQRWIGPWGESIWSFDKSLLSSSDLASFEPCSPISGDEFLKQVPELKSEVSPQEKVCVRFKEQKDEHVFLYLTEFSLVVRFAI
jgi:hypothetical protein